jgi:SAM-dependent methyltransferase
MKNKNYKSIVEHYEDCLDEHGDNHQGVDWPNKNDALKRYKVMLDVIPNNELASSNKLLDFGCGAAHLLEFVLKQEKYKDVVDYYGADLSEKFITLSKEKFDYVVLNGVFTEKRELTFNEMWSYFQEMIKRVFLITNKGIAFNVMSKAVEWERKELFHLPTDQLIDFLTKEISRNFIIRNDYGLYEYTVYIYK